MGYFNEFPHTKGYDGDLGYLIKMYKKLVAEYASIQEQYEALTKIYEMVQNDIKNITLEQLQEWLDDGTLEKIVNEAISTKYGVYTPGCIIKPSIFIPDMTEEEATEQLNYLHINSGFKDFVLTLHLEYNTGMELEIKESALIPTVTNYIENNNCKLSVLKFHMLESEFNKKSSDLSTIDYNTLVLQTISQFENLETVAIYNEAWSIISQNNSNVINLINSIKQLNLNVTIPYLPFSLMSNDIDSIQNTLNAIALNWYPAINNIAYPVYPTSDIFIDSFKSNSAIFTKMLKFPNTKMILSEFGIIPQYEALKSPSTTGSSEPVHTNYNVVVDYFSNFIDSGLINNFQEIWTWFNEYTSSEIQNFWLNYNNKMIYKRE